MIGEGQGGLIAATYGRPCALESVLASRNVQVTELYELAQAWGNVAGIVVDSPRFSRSRGIQLEKLRVAAPELFKDYPIKPLSLMACQLQRTPDYLPVKSFYRDIQANIFPSYYALPLGQLVDTPARLMWEHSGQCPCGKRSYLFAQTQIDSTRLELSRE